MVVHLRFAAGMEGATQRAVLSLSDAARVLHTSERTAFSSTRDTPRTIANRETSPFDREVARLYAAKAREEAVALNRAGSFDDAQRRLRAGAVADRIRSYAGNDPTLNRIADELVESEAAYSEMLSPQMAKSERYASYFSSRMRAPDGKAHRQP